MIAIVAFITGLNVIIGGAASAPRAAGAVEATVDNELRFFAGGIARLVSTMTLGHPGTILFGTMILELLLPFAIYVIYKKNSYKKT